MTVAPAADTEIVSGVIQGIVQKGPDKWQVEVNVGAQNPRRLWTKDAALVGQLSMMIGQSTSFMCGKSHWTNNQGQAVTSLWINGVGQGAQAPVQPMPQPVQPMPQPVQQMPMQMPMQAPTVVTPQVQPMAAMQPQVQMHPPRISEDERERRIHRQTASKVAGILISHVPAEQRTLDNVIALSERLVAYYDHGVQEPQRPQDGEWQGDPGAQGFPHTDNDIPF